MDSPADPDIKAVLDELRSRYPALTIWTEDIRSAGTHWMARGNPRPYLLMSQNLDRFRAELERIGRPL